MFGTPPKLFWGLRAAQGGPKTAQEAPKMAQETPNTAQEATKTGQEAPHSDFWDPSHAFGGPPCASGAPGNLVWAIPWAPGGTRHLYFYEHVCESVLLRVIEEKDQQWR